MTSTKVHPKNTDFIDDFKDEGLQDSDEASGSSKTAENFADLLNESLRKPNKKLSVGDKVSGKILVLGKQDVFVTTGTRFDGVVARVDLQNEKGECPHQVGDVLELYVTLVRGQEIRLSPHKTAKNLAEDLEDAYDLMLPIQGRIVEVCKGGVRVNLKGKLAFCPISQIDVKHIETADEYVGKSFEFRITQFSEGGRNIVVSRKALLKEEQELNSGSFLEEHPDGAIVPGKVVRLEKFGAFVELAPGVDGLVHISEIAGYRIGDPSEVLQSGQEVQVKILKREPLNGRFKISLSIKQAAPTQATETVASSSNTPGIAPTGKTVNPKFTAGQIFKGKVVRKEPYGLFVQLEPGVSGLLHQSRFEDHAGLQINNFRVGDEISVQIAEIKTEDQRISLQLPRDPDEDDWKNHQAPAQTQAFSNPFASLGAKLGGTLKDTKKK